MTEAVVVLLVTSSINLLRSFNDLCSLFVNVLLYAAHIFSAGFNSGLYGGKNSSAIFCGIHNRFAWWNAPLSSTTILNSLGQLFANSFKNI